jgi:hypothetical protein
LIDENQMKLYVQAKPSCFPAMFDEKHFCCVSRAACACVQPQPEAPEILLFCSSFFLLLGGFGASSQLWLGLSYVVDGWGGRHGRIDLRYGVLISDFGLQEFFWPKSIGVLLTVSLVDVFTETASIILLTRSHHSRPSDRSHHLLCPLITVEIISMPVNLTVVVFGSQLVLAARVEDCDTSIAAPLDRDGVCVSGECFFVDVEDPLY